MAAGAFPQPPAISNTACSAADGASASSVSTTNAARATTTTAVGAYTFTTLARPGTTLTTGCDVDRADIEAA